MCVCELECEVGWMGWMWLRLWLPLVVGRGGHRRYCGPFGRVLLFFSRVGHEEWGQERGSRQPWCLFAPLRQKSSFPARHPSGLSLVAVSVDGSLAWVEVRNQWCEHPPVPLLAPDSLTAGSVVCCVTLLPVVCALQFAESEIGPPLSPQDMSARMTELFGSTAALATGPVVLESGAFADVRGKGDGAGVCVCLHLGALLRLLSIPLTRPVHPSLLGLPTPIRCLGMHQLPSTLPQPATAGGECDDDEVAIVAEVTAEQVKRSQVVGKTAAGKTRIQPVSLRCALVAVASLGGGGECVTLAVCRLRTPSPLLPPFPLCLRSFRVRCPHCVGLCCMCACHLPCPPS